MAKARTDEALRSLLEASVASQGVEVDAVVITQQHGSALVRVVVEEPEGQPALDSDTLAEASRVISKTLDVHDPIEGEYLLEVTTPGIDRLLEKPAHWRRQLGRTVDVRLHDGQKLSGRILAATDDAVTLDVDGEAHEFEYPRIKKARARVEFTADTNDEE